VNFFDSNFLLASLLWGSIGAGCCIYGWRQKAMVPLIGGILTLAVSCFAGSALVMSLICTALMVGVYFLAKQGY
jgi:hypothetical protein